MNAPSAEAPHTGAQVDAAAVVNALTLEVAALTRRAIIAEQRVAALEAELASKEKKRA
nr:MAG TPA: hypothetical protein [Caudoviricetes sp.]